MLNLPQVSYNEVEPVEVSCTSISGRAKLCTTISVLERDLDYTYTLEAYDFVHHLLVEKDSGKHFHSTFKN